MTLFNIVTWNGKHLNILSASWKDAIDVFIDKFKFNENFNASDIEHVLYADINTKSGTLNYINGSLVAAVDGYFPAAPWNEVLEYLESK